MKRILMLVMLCSGFLLTGQEYQLAKPLVKVEGESFFENSAIVRCEFDLKGAVIRYTLDDSEPNQRSKRYKKPLTIKKSTTIKVKTFKNGFQASKTVRLDLFKMTAPLASIKLSPEPSGTYMAEGAKTLNDQKAGSFNFRDGRWVGYNKGPITIDIDLGKIVEKEKIVLNTLVSPDSWIMRPEYLSYTHSLDGKKFEQETRIGMIGMISSETAYKTFWRLIMDGPYRYVRITISPLSSIPDWHPGKGQPGWLFIDEIFIQQ
ncbi:FN3 associated domain-containing protein [Roseivirga sp.]|uniref:FN3 associated domain-containing protein n=1 Tax=Roseivirga sp. TaxID=1964215 RepID=UPI003B8DE42B